tara:strand:- start:152 stop:388 length:237 start_codon:yes stop_codon:yes gene_type:complete
MNPVAETLPGFSFGKGRPSGLGAETLPQVFGSALRAKMMCKCGKIEMTIRQIFFADRLRLRVPKRIISSAYRLSGAAK